MLYYNVIFFFQVEFVGEEAEDAGGVRKEFFMLLLKEIFDPVYGMFKQSEETNMIWFSNNPFEDDIMYYLIGRYKRHHIKYGGLTFYGKIHRHLLLTT